MGMNVLGAKNEGGLSTGPGNKNFNFIDFDKISAAQRANVSR
jgi:hypothetical protein